MYGEFTWWQGVVEDRVDPLKLGRVRVRILGYHTQSKQEGEGIPTGDLPWATPSQPITSAAMNGIGTTPLGPVEGTWVFGFFRDGKSAQEPVMTGTFGGIPEDKSNPTLGFNDPFGKYPLQTHLKEADTNRLAKGDGKLPISTEDAPSLIHKRKARQKDTPTALAGDMSTTIANTSSDAYTSTKWNEPNPRYGGTEDNDTTYLSTVKMSSQYPFNHVRMSESGHVDEWDDTPSAERLHRYHKTGTFEEVQPDGTKVTKIVGDEYEITLKNKKVLINGTCDVTIAGNARMLYKGDLVQEVEGDYHLHVHKDMRTKIHGNDVREVLADRKIVINGNDDLMIDKEQSINITSDRTINVGGTLSETINGAVQKTYMSTLATITGDNNTVLSAKNIDIVSLENLGLSSDSNCDISVTGNLSKTISGNETVTISGNNLEKVTGTHYLQVTGASRLQYKSTLDERHEGHYKIYTGDDTSSVSVSGKTDHGCPTTRSSDNSCNTAESVP